MNVTLEDTDVEVVQPQPVQSDVKLLKLEQGLRPLLALPDLLESRDLDLVSLDEVQAKTTYLEEVPDGVPVLQQLLLPGRDLQIAAPVLSQSGK